MWEQMDKIAYQKTPSVFALETYEFYGWRADMEIAGLEVDLSK